LAGHAQVLAEALGKAQTEEAKVSALNEFHNSTNGILELIRNGRLLTTDHPRFEDIRALQKSDVDAAAMLLVSCHSDARKAFNALISQGHFPWEVLVRTSLAAHPSLADYTVPIEFYKKGLRELKGKIEREFTKVTDLGVHWEAKFGKADEAEIGARSLRSKDWETFMVATNEAWTNRLKTYDEKMALAAPTTYWNKRANWAKFSAGVYAAIFLVVIGVATYEFVSVGIPYLASVAKPEIPILTAVLPIVVPAFAVIWIMRIIGRLLSESLQLAQDARERSTMVMTFLALMNDEVTGKTLVTDNDRLLILHSLFRPSAVSANDDSPPVNWFDILSRKFGGPSKP
jgi:hypothetical protein